MRRVLAVVTAAAAMVIGLATGTAGADVHLVSQASCGNSSSAGATQSRDAIGDPGRPAAQIPVTASGGKTQGQGGEADAEGQHCGFES
jgi:hypothetical protein